MSEKKSDPAIPTTPAQVAHAALHAESLTDYLDSLLNEVTEPQADIADVSEDDESVKLEEDPDADDLEPQQVHSAIPISEQAPQADSSAKPDLHAELAVVEVHQNPSRVKVSAESLADLAQLERNSTQIEQGSNRAGIEIEPNPEVSGLADCPEISEAEEAEAPAQTIIAPSRSRGIEFINEAIKTKEFADLISSEWQGAGKPIWGHGRFDCLLFQIGEIQVAAPLVKLGTILKVEEPFTPLVGQPDWFLGLMPNTTSATGQGRQSNVQVVNTARWLMGERYNPAFLESIEFVITLSDHRWGLACSHVQHATSVESEAIKWRSNHQVRPWLAGTVIDKMCSILDIQAIEFVLSYADFQQ